MEGDHRREARHPHHDNQHQHQQHHHHSQPRDGSYRQRNKRHRFARITEPTSTVIVRNVVNELTEEHLFSAAETQFQVQPQNVRIMRDMTGFTKGFAFMEFATIDLAREFIERSNRSMEIKVQRYRDVVGGKVTTEGELVRLELDYAEDRKQQQQQRPRSHDETSGTSEVYRDWICDKCREYNFGNRKKCFTCNTDRSENAQEIEVPKAKATHSLPPKSTAPSVELIVRGLDPNTTEEKLAQYFSATVPVKAVRVIRDKNSGQSRRFAFVEFFTLEASRYVHDACKEKQILAANSLANDNSTVIQDIVIDGTAVTIDYSKNAGGTTKSDKEEALQIAQWQSVYNDNYRAQSQTTDSDATTSASDNVVVTKEYLLMLQQNGFHSYDAKTGYYYSATLNYFFDPKTCYYYDNEHHVWLRHDAETQTYHPISTENSSTSGAASSPSSPSTRIEGEAVTPSLTLESTETAAQAPVPIDNSPLDQQNKPTTDALTNNIEPAGEIPSQQTYPAKDQAITEVPQEISAEATKFLSSVLDAADSNQVFEGSQMNPSTAAIPKKKITKKRDEDIASVSGITAMVGKSKSSKNIMRWNQKNQEIRYDVAADEKKRNLERQQKMMEKQVRLQQQQLQEQLQRQQQQQQQQQQQRQPHSQLPPSETPMFQTFAIGNAKTRSDVPHPSASGTISTTSSSTVENTTAATIGKGFVPNPNFKKAVRALADFQVSKDRLNTSRLANPSASTTTSYYGAAPKGKTADKKRKLNPLEYEHTEPANLLEDEENVGNKMLKKMGWGGGGLGRQEDGRREGIAVQQRDRSGLGFNDPMASDPTKPLRVEISPGDSYLDIARKKARARYEQTLKDEQR